MPKERSFNPAQQQRKADKQKEIAKNKKQLQNQRNEKLARRNPERIQRQIDELKELEQLGALRTKDKETLQQLERDVKGIRRAREALGDAAPKFPSRDNDKRNVREEQAQRRQQHQHLGKRRRDSEDAHDSDTDPEVRSIPMPRDTPPPIPRQPRERFVDPQVGPDGKRVPHALPAKPAGVPASKTVYSSAPQLRDLKKEAVKFMPSAVAAQKKRVKGEGRLLEPEEIDRLEKAGYYAAQKAAEEASDETAMREARSVVRAEAMEGIELDEEQARFERELANMEAEETMQAPRAVQMEEVEDEGD
jgi:hypothetical protein